MADEYIRKADAIRWVQTECNPYGKPTLDFESGKKVIEHLERMSPADVVPVVHGKWLPIVSYNNTYKCSECGRLLVDITDGLKMVAKHYPYCHCGAKMDAQKEG